jgi:sulfite exporter TauE/SafE
MMEVATPIAAFTVGLATSLHCAGMCGPLACAVGAKPLTYHGSRAIAYPLVGALCGGFGQVVSSFLDSPPMRLAPWAMVVVLLGIALGLEKRLPQPRWLKRLMIQARLRQNLGFLTPLLPCGPLWMMFGVAAVSASAVSGALLLLAFVAGTIPLYAFLQASVAHGQRRLSGQWLSIAQRSLAVVAAGLLVWRTLSPHGCCH